MISWHAKPLRLTWSCLCLAGVATAAGPVRAQVNHIPTSYDVRLSGYCQSIAERDAIISRGGDYRVRRGSNVVANGVRQMILVDMGASVEVRGSSAMIYVARGGRVTLQGDRNQVFAEPGGNVFLMGGGIVTQVASLNVITHRNGSECE